MTPLCFAAYIALFMEMSCLALGLVTRSHKASPFDTALVSTFEGPDMIPLYPKGLVPGKVPSSNSAAYAYVKGEQSLKRCKCKHNTSEFIYLVQEPALKPYLLDEKAANRSDTAVIVAPGGNNSLLAWAVEGMNVAEWLNSLGVNAFVLEYRVPSDKHGALIDAQRAMSFVRYHAADYGLNSSQIGFMGFFSGGFLTTSLSITTERMYSKIDEADDVDFAPDFALVIYGGGVSEITSSMHKPPPTFSISAQDDPCIDVDKSTAYCTAVRRDADQECVRFVYANGGHGFGTCELVYNAWSGNASCAWPNDAELWMRHHKLLKA